MTLKECLLINNKCYRWRGGNSQNNPRGKANMVGIVVHDTGGGNPNLKRYVQPDKSQSYYRQVLDDLGVNTNGNDWNKDNERYACVHAFIGLNAKNQIETYQTLPYDIQCWGVGDGKYGSYNYNPTAHIQFEICDDGYKSKDYFEKAMKEAQEYCAYLCTIYGWNSDVICCHYESYQRGYGGNHNDITVWLRTFGKNMDWFRNEVQKILDNKKQEEEPMTTAEKKEFESLKKEVETLKKDNAELKKINKVYHYWDEIKKEASWAYAPLKAMFDNGYFSGASASDLALPKTKMEILVVMANQMKKEGKLKY